MNTAANTVSARPPRYTTAPSRERRPKKKFGAISTATVVLVPAGIPGCKSRSCQFSLHFVWRKKKATDASHLHDAAVEIKSGVVLSIAMVHADNRRAKVQVERGQWTPPCETFIANSDTSATISAVKFQVLCSVEKQNLLRVDQ